MTATRRPRPLRGAIVGFGNVAVEGHLPAWRQHRQFTIVAVCDSDEERLALAADLLPTAKRYTSRHGALEERAARFRRRGDAAGESRGDRARGPREARARAVREAPHDAMGGMPPHPQRRERRPRRRLHDPQLEVRSHLSHGQAHAPSRRHRSGHARPARNDPHHTAERRRRRRHLAARSRARRWRDHGGPRMACVLSGAPSGRRRPGRDLGRDGATEIRHRRRGRHRRVHDRVSGGARRDSPHLGGRRAAQRRDRHGTAREPDDRRSHPDHDDRRARPGRDPFRATAFRAARTIPTGSRRCSTTFTSSSTTRACAARTFARPRRAAVSSNAATSRAPAAGRASRSSIPSPTRRRRIRASVPDATTARPFDGVIAVAEGAEQRRRRSPSGRARGVRARPRRGASPALPRTAPDPRASSSGDPDLMERRSRRVASRRGVDRRRDERHDRQHARRRRQRSPPPKRRCRVPRRRRRHSGRSTVPG